MSTVTDFLTNTCTVSGYVVSQSPTGAKISTPTEIATGVACVFQVVKASQRMQPESGETEYDVYFEYSASQSITYGNELSAVGGKTSQTFRVITEPEDDAGEQAYLRVRAQHVTGRAAPRE